jgi:hypothetical protein
LPEHGKAVLKEKFIVIVPLFKSQRYQINNLTMYFKLLEKEKQAKSESNRWKQIIKIRDEIKDMETKRM